ncbi:uncharacterized protein LOC121378713 [Gigantopelta aegis]|uniref:uncharacterized protein LOC121378713 n=1 Tax=Gigantopelta aegis TaxID=1735272 RepID=UPI001B88D175|nr:uncharacterized protein LOC121378713 [Gigantopelta aegis]
MTKAILGPLALAFGLMLICCVERTDGRVSLQDAKALWRHMVDGLFFVSPKDRKAFINQCLKKTFCGPQLFDGKLAVFHWRHGGINKVQKLRFWSIYNCVYRRSLYKCPVDGAWSVWSRWTTCGVECGETGVKTRSRLCNNPIVKHNGLPCRGLKVMSTHCVGRCDATHVDGMQEAQEYLSKIHSNLPNLHVECIKHHCNFERVSQLLDVGRRQKYWSSLLCVKYFRACPVDGGWGKWSEWTQCSKKCGYGRRERERLCNNPSPVHGGVVCDGRHFESESCFGSDCKNPKYDNVLMSEWSDFTPCSITCGAYGQQESVKMCLRPNQCTDEHGNPIERLVIDKPCYQGPCPRTGGWSKWSQWTPCSANCGQGRRTQIRMCINPLPSGGLDCLGLSIKTGMCTGVKCEKTAETDIDVNSTGPEVNEIVEPASGDPFFEPLDLAMESQFTLWLPWTSCSQTCGGGHRSRRRTCRDPSTVCIGEVKQDQFCDLEPCPVTGGWSNWLSWSPCAETCGPSHRVRYRQCDEPLPAYGGACFGDDSEQEPCNLRKCKGGERTPSDWSEWSECSTTCGDGIRTRTSATHNTVVKDMCNIDPCPVQGAWSNWGEWSACTVTCGLGQHFRDRACSDPSPVYGGAECIGTGTDILHCYEGPCRDADDKGLAFTSGSSMFYKYFIKPTRFLLLYVRLMLLSSSGILVERHSGCAEETGCQHHIVLSFENGFPTLTVKDGKSSLKVVGNLTLEVETWNDLQVGITSQNAYIRVNDGRHVLVEYDEPPDYDIDFDADMFIGTSANNSIGFHGVISELRQNYRPLNLIRSTDWVGPGSPSKQKSVVETDLEPEISHSEFRGRFYAKLYFEHTQVLQIQLIMQLYALDGLILYNEGQVPGSYVAMFVEKGAAKMCLNCGIETECQESVDLQLKRWYYITLEVYGLEAELRIDRHPAIQITGVGKKYFPDGELFLGKPEPAEWLIIEMATGVKKGFSGIVNVLVVNGQRYSFKRAALIDSDGFMNSMGYTMSAHLDEILEHAEDIVYLKCDFTDFGSKNAYAEWLKSDRLLKADLGTIIIPKLPGRRNESAIHLLPGKHTQGMYSCAVNKNGRIIMTHAFSLWRHSVSLTILNDLDEIDVGIIIVSGILVIAIIAGIIRIIVVRRRSFALARETARKSSIVSGASVEKIRRPSVSFHDKPSSYVQDNIAANASVFGEDYLEGSRFVIIDGVPVMIDDDDDTVTTATTAESGSTAESRTTGESGTTVESTEDEGEDETENDDQTEDDNDDDDETEEEDPVAEVEQALQAESAAKLIQDNKEKVFDIIQSISNMADSHNRMSPSRRASSASPTRAPTTRASSASPTRASPTRASSVSPIRASPTRASSVSPIRASSVSPTRASSASPTRKLSSTITPQPGCHRRLSVVSMSPPQNPAIAEPRYSLHNVSSASRRPSRIAQSGSVYQAHQQRPSFQGSPPGPSYQGTQLGPSYQGSQLGPSYQGLQQRPSFQGSPTGHSYQGPQTGHSYQGPQTGHSYQGPQAGHLNQGPQAGHLYQGPQTGHSYQGPQAGHLYQGPQAEHLYQGPQAGHSYQESQAGQLYQGPQAEHSYKGPQSGYLYQGPQVGHSYQGPQAEHSYQGPQSGYLHQGPQVGDSYQGPQSGHSYQGPQSGHSYQGRPR